ncbi:unnamed protein product [Lampetra fluviatilis]
MRRRRRHGTKAAAGGSGRPPKPMGTLTPTLSGDQGESSVTRPPSAATRSRTGIAGGGSERAEKAPPRGPGNASGRSSSSTAAAPTVVSDSKPRET